MKKPCKECPHTIRNQHNDMIVEFGKRTGKKHNCHIGIEVKLSGNYPWVYIDEICGIRVKEKFAGNHGFTIIFLPVRNDTPPSDFTDIKETFKLIRKYSREALLIKMMEEDQKNGLYDL